MKKERDITHQVDAVVMRRFMSLVLKALYQLLNAVILNYCHRDETKDLKDQTVSLWEELDA